MESEDEKLGQEIESAESEVDRLETDGSKLDEQISEAKQDWAAKRRDSSVPGATPPEGDEENS